jgi:4-hydroxy-tetrahydrodipicolinate reductase
VHFSGPGERIELTHRATQRSLFAIGAVRAFEWLLGQPAGLYAMEDLILGSALKDLSK